MQIKMLGLGLGMILVSSLGVARADHDGDAGFVPPGCTVESWCLEKATECFFGHFTHPQGLWQGHAQYSVVRRVVAVCSAPYGHSERRQITGPVEPVRFASDVETKADVAQSSALGLCGVYRADWVGAAPVCKPGCGK